MTARIRLAEWIERLEKANAQMSREELCFLMVQARHLIEASASPNEYRVAAFYADWLVHSAIDRSAVCFDVLRDVNAVLVANLNPTRPDLTSEISRLVGLPRLRAELIALFRSNALDTAFFEYLENWRGIAGFLLWSLREQPLRLPKDHTKRSRLVLEEMQATSAPADVMVESLQIVEYENQYHWQLFVGGRRSVTVLGRVDIAEPASAFLPAP